MIKDQLLKLLADVAGNDEVLRNPQLDLFGTQMLDSLRTVELIVMIDEQFGVSVSPAEFDREAWATPEKFIADVEARRAALA